MATESKRYVHVIGTTTELTTANDIMKPGELWVDETLGLFKIATVEDNYNDQPFYVHPWANISGKPSSYPSTISDVSGLTAALAGKLDATYVPTWASITGKPSTFTPASHNHAASETTSGVFDPARIPLATASTFGAVKPGTGLSVTDGVLNATGGGGGGGLDRGTVYDIRTYGAVEGFANRATNRAAMQSAINAAGAAGGGVVYIPGGTWHLSGPAWQGWDNVAIVGENVMASVLSSETSAIVVAEHPRYWPPKKTTFLDTDASMASVNVTTTESGRTVVADVDKYRVDIREFRAAGAYPPLNGNPSFGPSEAMSAGVYWVPRSRRGVMSGIMDYVPLATGDLTQTNQTASSWHHQGKYCWSFVVYKRETYIVGGICAAGGILAPDPWGLYGSPGFVFTSGAYLFELALANADRSKRSYVRIEFEQTNTLGIHRICVQYDSTTTDPTKRFACYVDGVQVTHYLHDISNANVNFDQLGGTSTIGTTWVSVARWESSAFGVLREHGNAGRYDSEYGGTQLTDYMVVAHSIHADLKYQIRNVGDAQIRTGSGAAADDSLVWHESAGNSSDTTALGWLACQYENGAAGDQWNGWNMSGRGRGVSTKFFGFLAPKCSDPGACPATVNPAIEDITVDNTSNFPMGCGILLGPYLHLRMKSVRVRYGFQASIGSLYTYTSYIGTFDDIYAGKFLHFTHHTARMKEVQFGYPRRCAIRLTGSQLDLDGFFCPPSGAYEDGFVYATEGGSIAAGLSLRNGMVNWEGQEWEPEFAWLHVKKHGDHGNNYVRIYNVIHGAYPVPTYIFRDTIGNQDLPTDIDIEHSGVCAQSPIAIVQGKDWRGVIKIRTENLFNATVEYRACSDSSKPNFPSLRTEVDAWGLPQCGGYTGRAHVINVRDPARGGVTKWISHAADNALYFEGSATPPLWRPLEIAPEAPYQHALSADGAAGHYLTCTIPWPASSTTPMRHTTFSNGAAKQILAYLFMGGSEPVRASSKINWGFVTPHHESTGFYPTGFFESGTLTNSSLWGAASGGQITNATAITLNGIDPDGTGDEWTVSLQREMGFAYSSFTSAQTPIILGKTAVTGPTFWKNTNGQTLTIPIGGLKIARQAGRSDGWTNYWSNAFLNWLRGQSFTVGTNLYIGLSTTPVSTTDGSGITEPSGGYSRFLMPRTSTYWQIVGDSVYLVGNKVPIGFGSPSSDWGTPRQIFIVDASTAGNVLRVFPINRPRYIRAGDDAPTIEVNGLRFQL